MRTGCITVEGCSAWGGKYGAVHRAIYGDEPP